MSGSYPDNLPSPYNRRPLVHHSCVGAICTGIAPLRFGVPAYNPISVLRTPHTEEYTRMLHRQQWAMNHGD